MHFIGSYNFSLDQKNRLVIPSKWRQVLSHSVVLTKGLDKCLQLRSVEEFQIFSEKILNNIEKKTEDYNNLLRYIFGSSVDLEVDRTSRILLPQELLNFIGAEKEIHYVGVGNMVEIWNPKDFQAKQERINSSIIANIY